MTQEAWYTVDTIKVVGALFLVSLSICITTAYRLVVNRVPCLWRTPRYLDRSVGLPQTRDFVMEVLL